MRQPTTRVGFDVDICPSDDLAAERISCRGLQLMATGAAAGSTGSFSLSHALWLFEPKGKPVAVGLVLVPPRQPESRPPRSSARPTVPGQGIHLGDLRALGGSLALCLGMAQAAVARTVSGEPLAHHDSLDLGAIEVADRDAPIIRSLAGQLAPNLFAEHERLDGFRGLSAAWLTPLRRRDPHEADRMLPSSIVSPSRT
jgi:hypothetical protein